MPAMTLLGTGTSMGVPMIGCECDVCRSDNPLNNRTRSGVYIEGPAGNLLIDTSPELRIQLLREDVSLVHAVLFTHAHADHIYGLDDLRLFGLRLKQAIPLYCEPPVGEMLQASFSYAFRPPAAGAHPGATPQLEIRHIDTDPFELCGMEVVPIRLIHGRLPILGYRIGDVAFCTDCSEIPEESWERLQGLDTLIIDALRDQPHPTHFSVDESLAVIDRLQPRQAYLTHISHNLEHAATNARLPADVEVAYDGLRIAMSPSDLG